jgi:hypothetical protein
MNVVARFDQIGGAMSDTEIFHIEPTHERMAGRRQGQQQRRHQRHELVNELFEALQAQDLNHSRLLYQQLVNMDVHLTQDADFARVGKLLQEGNIDAALHFAKEYRLRQVNAQHFAGQGAPVQSVTRTGSDKSVHLSMTSSGSLEHLVDLKA